MDKVIIAITELRKYTVLIFQTYLGCTTQTVNIQIFCPTEMAILLGST